MVINPVEYGLKSKGGSMMQRFAMSNSKPNPADSNETAPEESPNELWEDGVRDYLLQALCDLAIRMYGKIKVQANFLLNAKRASARLSKCQILRSLFEMSFYCLH
ncbi:hypothetical protein E2542_SST19771 [Spatholobus suberectus]|nr:hypothetical protein E2542_SST19771 [Spatholobus suberectus]